TLPPPPPPTTQPKTQTVKPLSDWEATRKQLRGEEVKQARAPAAKQPDLAEALLKLLADNGHNFSLAPQEAVTVAVVFRAATPTKTGNALYWEMGHTFGSNYPVPFQGTKPPAPAPKTGAKETNPGKDLELLADLQLKQNKAEEAVVLYL